MEEKAGRMGKLKLPMTEGDIHLSLPRLMAFAAPQWPLAAIGLPIAVFLPPLYAGDLGLGVQAVGLVFLIARLWDVVTDPIMGVVSDKFPSRFGRRRHWIFVGTPILLMAAFVVFNPTMFFASITPGALLACLVIMYVGWTMVTLNHLAWASEIHSAYHERSRIQGAVQAFIIVGLIVTLLVPFFAQLQGANKIQETGAIGWYMFVTLPIAVWIAILLVPESRKVATSERTESPGPREALKVLASNAPLRRLLLVYLADGFLGGTIASLFMFFATYVLELEKGAQLLLLFYFLSGAVCTPLWIRLSYKIGKHKALVASFAYSAATISLMLLIPKGNFIAAGLVFIVFGANYGSAQFLARSIMSDVTDYDMHKTGEQRTGLYFSLLTLTMKLGVALAIGAVYSIFLPMIGFEAGVDNPESAVRGLLYIYILTPIIIPIIMAVLMWGFPLTEETQKILRAEIAEREAVKAKG